MDPFSGGGSAGLRGIGSGNEKAVPKLAIVDGQQRLTSLYAVMKGKEVLRANFKKERIRIAFNPLAGRFNVFDAAIAKDKSYIPDISVLWQPDVDIFEIADRYVDELNEVRPLTREQTGAAKSAINKLKNLPNYQFVALTLAASVEAETIAEVFVRVNGEGKKLNQSDFIMTLMSVFWDAGRAELETFARLATQPSDGQASPYNHFIRPSPDQMLRATVGVSLKRARLENVYSALRGRDAKTGLDNPQKRDQQFALMQQGQEAVLNLANWHHFLSALALAGYRSSKMISSETAIIYSYVLYIIGVVDYGIPKDTMRQTIAEFFFMVALTGRYSNSPETRFEADLALLRELSDGDVYQSKLRELCITTLTNDYWAITLPNQLATSASRGPALFAYQASLVKLEASALFSNSKIPALVDPVVRGTRAALEQHHLFPRGYLEGLGQGTKQINQIANFAPVEWPQNIQIGKKPPSEYVPDIDKKLDADERERQYFWHALPPLWWELNYDEFLIQRRVRIAKVVRAAWDALSGKPKEKTPRHQPISELIAGGENGNVEFKSTLRTNLHTSQVDDKMQLAVLKTIAGFLNAQGGSLLIGVADDGEVLGIGADGFPNEDKMGLHLVNLIRDRIDPVFLPYVHPQFEENNGRQVLAVRCERGPKAAFVKDGTSQRFFVRGSNATVELTGAEIPEYVKHRFD